MGRNVAILVEVAARNHVLKRMGVHAAQAFTAALGGATGPGSPDPARDARNRRKPREERGRCAASEATRGDAAMSGLDFIVVTGMSGAGKSAASRCLEDLGFLLHRQPAGNAHSQGGRSVRPVREAHRARGARDRRPGGPIPGRPVRDPGGSAAGREPGAHGLSGRQRRGAGAPFQREPASASAGPGGSALEGIRAERARLAALKAKADLVIDTSGFTVHEFRKLLATSFLDLPAPPRTVVGPGVLRIPVWPAGGCGSGVRHPLPPQSAFRGDVASPHRAGGGR